MNPVSNGAYTKPQGKGLAKRDTRMATALLGSKHNRPAKVVRSAVRSDAKVRDMDEAESLKFWGPSEKPRFSDERYIPYLAVGKDASKASALKAIDQFITSLEEVSKADSIKVEGPNGTVHEGPKPNLAPGGNGASMPAYVVSLLQDAYILAHQQEMNTATRASMLKAAEKEGVLEAKAAKVAGERTRGRDAGVF